MCPYSRMLACLLGVGVASAEFLQGLGDKGSGTQGKTEMKRQRERRRQRERGRAWVRFGPSRFSARGIVPELTVAFPRKPRKQGGPTWAGGLDSPLRPEGRITWQHCSLSYCGLGLVPL